MQIRQVKRILKKLDKKYRDCTISQDIRRYTHTDEITVNYTFVSILPGVPVLNAPTLPELFDKMKEKGIL